MLVAVAVTGEVLSFLAITQPVDRPRPLAKHLDVAPPTSGFPSGHTAASVALDGAWALLAWQRSRSAAAARAADPARDRGPDRGRAAARVPGHARPADVLAGALLGTGWLVVTVRGSLPGVRHRELRAETAGENPANPARRWPRPRHG
jgi:hypothetical protein